MQEKRGGTGCILAIIALIIAGIGLCINALEKWRCSNARDGLENGEWELVLLQEEEPDAVKRLQQITVNELGQPVVTVGMDEYFRYVDKAPAGLPTPQYVRSYKDHDSSRKHVAIYRIFSGKDCKNKMREWLQQERYSHSDFQLEWEKNYWTKPIIPRREGSSIAILAFYRVGGRLYMWDGNKVYDLTAGLTGNVHQEGEQYYREMAEKLTNLGR